MEKLELLLDLPALELPVLELPPEPCMYLPDRMAKMQYRFGRRMTAEKFERLLARGWRRFGSTVFRPDCPACSACRSLRVCVDDFAPSKSQRRTIRRNANVRVEMRPISVTPQHIALFNAYHADMHDRRGWPQETINEEEYWLTFADGACDFAREMQYYRGDALIGVGLVDLLPNSSSSVYFYHDPAWRPQSPGTFSMLTEIEMARRAGRRHHYLGYWIAENQSMAYKSRFRPHELLRSHVGDREPPDWHDHV